MRSKLQIIDYNNELVSSTISWLRLPLIIGVIYIHMNPHVNWETVNFQHLKWNDIYMITVLLISLVSRIAVPCFFMFSGFLYFYNINKWNTRLYINKTGKRIKTLVVPYIIWNLIPFFLAIVNRLINGGLHEYIRNTGIINVLWNYSTLEYTNFFDWKLKDVYPYNTSLWFLRDLFIIGLFSPIVYYFIRFTRHYGIIVLGLLYYIRIWFFTPDSFVASIFFFSLGAFFSIHKENFILFFNKKKVLWLIISLISMLLVISIDQNNWRSIFFPVFVMSGVASINIIISNLLFKGKIKVNHNFSKASFFVYVAHHIFIMGFWIHILDIFIQSENVFIVTLKFLVIPLLTVTSLILVYFFMKKAIPKTVNILTGER